MFKSVCLRFDQNSFPTDIGLLAESLLYYDQVIILGQPDTLPLILNSISRDILIDLLLKKSIRLCVLEDFLAVTSKPTEHGPIPNNILQLRHANPTTESQIFDSLYKSNDRRGYSKRLLAQILPYIELTKYPTNLTQLIKNDLYDSDYVKKIFIDIIKNHLPDLELSPNQFVLEFTEGEKTSFGFRSTLDLQKIKRMTLNNADNNEFNLASVVGAIQRVRGDLHLSSLYSSELITNPFCDNIIKYKFEDIHKKVTNSQENIRSFNDLVLDNGYAIREAINRGQYSFDDFKSILDKSLKFKKWLQGKPENSNLIKEYHNAVTSETWAEKLPVKILRWSVFAALGMSVESVKDHPFISQGLSIALGIGDTFLLDRILRGWNPSSFIETELSKIKKTI